MTRRSCSKSYKPIYITESSVSLPLISCSHIGQRKSPARLTLTGRSSIYSALPLDSTDFRIFINITPCTFHRLKNVCRKIDRQTDAHTHRKCNSSDQATLFYCAGLIHSRHFQWWTGESMGTLTSRLHNPIASKLRCSDTFLSYPALTLFLVMCVTVALQ